MTDTLNEKPAWPFWTLAALFVFLIYPLSIGPVMYAIEHFAKLGDLFWFRDMYEIVYGPLLLAADNSEFLSDIYWLYLSLWVELGI